MATTNKRHRLGWLAATAILLALLGWGGFARATASTEPAFTQGFVCGWNEYGEASVDDKGPSGGDRFKIKAFGGTRTNTVGAVSAHYQNRTFTFWTEELGFRTYPWATSSGNFQPPSVDPADFDVTMRTIDGSTTVSQIKIAAAQFPSQDLVFWRAPLYYKQC